MKLTMEEIDAQIKSLEVEVAKYTQNIFEARGALNLAIHMKKTFEFEIKTCDVAAKAASGGVRSFVEAPELIVDALTQEGKVDAPNSPDR